MCIEVGQVTPRPCSVAKHFGTSRFWLLLSLALLYSPASFDAVLERMGGKFSLCSVTVLSSWAYQMMIMSIFPEINWKLHPSYSWQCSLEPCQICCNDYC